MALLEASRQPLPPKLGSVATILEVPHAQLTLLYTCATTCGAPQVSSATSTMFLLGAAQTPAALQLAANEGECCGTVFQKIRAIMVLLCCTNTLQDPRRPALCAGPHVQSCHHLTAAVADSN